MIPVSIAGAPPGSTGRLRPVPCFAGSPSLGTSPHQRVSSAVACRTRTPSSFCRPASPRRHQFVVHSPDEPGVSEGQPEPYMTRPPGRRNSGTGLRGQPCRSPRVSQPYPAKNRWPSRTPPHMNGHVRACLPQPHARPLPIARLLDEPGISDKLTAIAPRQVRRTPRALWCSALAPGLRSRSFYSGTRAARHSMWSDQTPSGPHSIALSWFPPWLFGSPGAQLVQTHGSPVTQVQPPSGSAEPGG